MDGNAPMAGLPRLFALMPDPEEAENTTEVLAWGLALPDGQAVTIGTGRSVSVGKWSTPGRAAALSRAELVWIGG
jgi:hypothetical protein